MGMANNNGSPTDISTSYYSGPTGHISQTLVPSDHYTRQQDAQYMKSLEKEKKTNANDRLSKMGRSPFGPQKLHRKK